MNRLMSRCVIMGQDGNEASHCHSRHSWAFDGRSVDFMYEVVKVDVQIQRSQRSTCNRVIATLAWQAWQGLMASRGHKEIRYLKEISLYN